MATNHILEKVRKNKQSLKYEDIILLATFQYHMNSDAHFDVRFESMIHLTKLKLKLGLL